MRCGPPDRRRETGGVVTVSLGPARTGGRASTGLFQYNNTGPAGTGYSQDQAFIGPQRIS